MYRRRLAAHLHGGTRAAVVICNRGARAGASLEHPHSQLFALPVIPPLQVDELANFERFRNRYGGCLLCEEREKAAADGRLVIEGPVAAWVPAAARWQYELWLAPAKHQPDFRDGSMLETARVLRRVLAVAGRGHRGRRPQLLAAQRAGRPARPLPLALRDGAPHHGSRRVRAGDGCDHRRRRSAAGGSRAAPGAAARLIAPSGRPHARSPCRPLD